MAKRKTAVPFKGTAEQEKKLKEIITRYKDTPGPLMPVLQEAQELYGYLPIEVQKIIAEGLNLPLEQIYGVATFYAQFTLNPKGKFRISVCLGTACYVKGAASVLEKLQEVLGIEAGGITDDGKFSIESARCLGCCALAPVMTVTSDKYGSEVYGRLVPGDVEGILAKYEYD